MKRTPKEKTLAMKILLGAGIAALAIGIALVGLYFWSQNRILDKGGMAYEPDPNDASIPAVTSIRIVRAGDSLGCYYSWEAVLVSGGRVLVTVTSQPTHSDREKVWERTVDLGILEEVTRIVDEHGMTAWDDLPASEFFALDAASTSVTFVWRGEEHSFSDSKEIPDGGWAAIRDIKTLLETAAGK